MAVNTIVNKGNPANRIDIVFMGDGYTADLVKTTYYEHVNLLVDYLFQDGGQLAQPFLRYKNFFNIHVIEIVSNQTGADVPPENIFVDTALGSRYFFDGVTERLLSVDFALGDAALTAGLAGTDIDPEIRFVTINSERYGGGGGYFATYSGGNPEALEVAVHEVGHSFADLADEYGGDPGAYNGPEPAEANVTKDPTGAKWAHWLGHDEPGIGPIGAYEGGRYFDEGIFRPSDNSKMRNIGQPFDAVSREQFILKFYDLVRPLDAYTLMGGAAGVLPDSLAAGDIFDFAVTRVDDAIIKMEWTIDGLPGIVATGGGLDIRELDLKPGKIVVRARAFDDTDWVRVDKHKLEQKVVWDLTVAENQTILGGDAGSTLRGAFTNDTITGGAGNDFIFGYAGNDFLDGGAGSNVLYGGSGDNTMVVRSVEDVVIVSEVFAPAMGFGGHNKVVSYADVWVDWYWSADEVIIHEDNPHAIAGIIHGGTDGKLVGNSGANILFGFAGNVSYLGGDGVDFFGLNRFVEGDTGVHTVIVEVSAEGFSWDVVYAFETGTDVIDLSDYGYASRAEALTFAYSDGAAGFYVLLGDLTRPDILYLADVGFDQIGAVDFVV